MTYPAHRNTTHSVVVATSVTPTEPGSAAQNDIMLYWLVVAAAGGAITGPTGGWSTLATIDGTNTRARLYGIRRGSSAPGLQSSWPSSTYGEVTVTAVSGCVTSGTAWTVQANAATQRNPTNPNCPSVTTPSSECLVYAFGMGWTGAGTGGWTMPSGYTSRFAGSPGDDLCVGEKQVATASAEDPAAFANAASAGLDDVGEVTVALQPAVTIILSNLERGTRGLMRGMY